MGAGDVKLMAGLGAWLGWEVTFWAFIATVVVGACMAVVMAWRSGQFHHHAFQAVSILKEIVAVKDPRQLSAIAAALPDSVRPSKVFIYRLLLGGQPRNPTSGGAPCVLR